jgi:hypothetical protein
MCLSALRYGKIARMAEPLSDPDGPASDSEALSPKRKLLHDDMSKEYYALLDVVSKYDGWMLIVKGWSVTLSLAALGLGFQQRHYALFAIAAVTGAAFWYLDGLMKGFQYRYYVRMREIEYSSYRLNSVILGGLYKEEKISAPRIDMTWDFTGYLVDEKDHDKLLDPKDMKDIWWKRVLKKTRCWWKQALAFINGPDPCLDQPTRTPEHPDYRGSEPWRREPWEIYKWLRHRWWRPNVMLPHVIAVDLGSLLFIIFLALNAAGVDHLRL